MEGVTRSELVRLCLSAIEAQHEERKKPGVLLGMTKGRPPRGFPRGELVSVGSNGSRNYRFPAIRVLRWALEDWPKDPTQ